MRTTVADNQKRAILRRAKASLPREKCISFPYLGSFEIYELVLTLPNCLISEEKAVEGFKKYGKSHCCCMSIDISMYSNKGPAGNEDHLYVVPATNLSLLLAVFSRAKYPPP